jgi:hypothetical protein
LKARKISLRLRHDLHSGWMSAPKHTTFRRTMANTKISPGGAPRIPPHPDYDLLAVTYLDFQDAGSRLRDLAYTVAEYRRHAAAPGRRSARKADLTAAAKAARRLQTVMGKIDIRTRVAALDLGIARRNVPVMELLVEAVGPATPGAPREVTQVPLIRHEFGPHSVHSDLADLLRLMNVLDTVASGFEALADGERVDAPGGRPVRHDALLMGLQGLRGFWERHRSDKPTQSQKARGFGAFAQQMFTSEPVGFPAASVRGAVIDFLPGGGSKTQTAR